MNQNLSMHFGSESSSISEGWLLSSDKSAFLSSSRMLFNASFWPFSKWRFESGIRLVSLRPDSRVALPRSSEDFLSAVLSLSALKTGLPSKNLSKLSLDDKSDSWFLAF